MRTRENELRFVYLFFDLLILNFSIIFLGWLRLDVEVKDFHQISVYLLLGNLSLLLTLSLFARQNLYLRDGYYSRFKQITHRSIVFIIIIAFLGFLLLPKSYSRSFILEYSLIFYLIKLIFYRFLYGWLKYRRQKGHHTNRVLIVGINDTTRFLRRIIESNPMLGYKFIGFADDGEECIDCLGRTGELEQIIRKHKIQLVVVSLSLFASKMQTRECLNICSKLGIRLRFIPEYQQWLRSKHKTESVGELIMINPQEMPLDNMGNRVLKRLFDLIFSLTVLILFFSWFFPIIALLIKLSSKGPVFFVQKRTGFNNKVFNCVKFRSMQVNGDANRKQACANDSRITWMGKFMRKTNIDELPQFFNVLAGDMSVVGPRPHMIRHTKQYSELIDHYLIRHYIKPGITGWAQINGFRGETRELWKMEKRVEYDIEYMEGWSFWWDMDIVWRTLFHLNAYKNAG